MAAHCGLIRCSTGNAPSAPRERCLLSAPRALPIGRHHPHRCPTPDIGPLKSSVSIFPLFVTFIVFPQLPGLVGSCPRGWVWLLAAGWA